MSEPAPEFTAGLSAIRAWCGWHVAPSLTETLKVESLGGWSLLVPSLYVTNVAEVRNEAGDVITGYKWRSNGVLRGTWLCEEQYEVDLTHGYDEMPLELQGIVDQLNAAALGQSVRSQAAGPFSVTYGPADLESQPLSVRAIIGRYRLPPRP